MTPMGFGALGMSHLSTLLAYIILKKFGTCLKAADEVLTSAEARGDIESHF